MLKVEDRFRRLVEDLRLIVWEFDPASKRFTYVSPQAESILGYSLPQWQEPEFWYQHVHPEDREQAMRFSRRHVERGEDHEFEYRMLHATGRAVWIRDLTSVIKRDGRVVALHGVLIDISDHVRVEQALRQSEQRFRSLAESSVVGIWQVTTDRGETQYINPSMCRLLGVDGAGDLAGRTYHEFFSPENLEIIRREHSARIAGQPTSYEVEIRAADGVRRRVIISGSPVFNADGAVVSMIGTFTDISQRVQAERELKRSNHLQQLLLSELDHRVRNNLASLAALLDISARDTRPVGEFAAAIRHRVHAMSVVHALLSRAHWRSVELRQLAQTLAPAGEDSALQMRGPAVEILARQATALGMVLQELFVNSRKYGALRAGAGGRIELEWRMETVADGAHAVRVTWRERGGPPITPPLNEGVGTGLVHGLVKAELRGEAILTYPREGATHEFIFRLDEREPEENAADPD